jgi:uncharacterized protein (DUF1778 family)
VRQLQNKEVLINIRLRYETREEFRVAAELRGATMSGLLHQFIVRTIREEKERDPAAFVELQSADLSKAEHSSEQSFDPNLSPQQNAIYKKFLKHQKSRSSETVDDQDVAHSKDSALKDMVNKSDKNVGKK